MDMQLNTNVRLLMLGKEVGSIIGKKGEFIKSMRALSRAHINISDGSTPERIVTLTGTMDCLSRAFTMICNKFEEDLQSNTQNIQLSLRLIVPAVQCGSIIGKSGNKIKNLRESTNTSIQISSELLPNSTERTLTISGNKSNLNSCFIKLCKILMECPIKADPIPYCPFIPATNTMYPVVLINSQAYQIQGNYIVPVQPHELFEVVPYPQMDISNGPAVNNVLQSTIGSCDTLQIGSTLCMHPDPTSMIPHNSMNFHQQSKQLTISKDLIGCIIGRGGQKISEIRQISGANIKISDHTEDGSERKVTLTGTYEQVGIGEALIQSRIANEIGGIILTTQ